MFHLCKQTRIYQGEPYCGPSSDGVPQEYENIHQAKAAKIMLQDRNPVGWNIWDDETGRLVDGVDHFEES